MKLKHFIPIIISLCLFGIFLILPSSWFSGLITPKTIENQRTSLSDQVLKGTLIQDKMFKSNHFYPIYGSSELGKDDPFNPSMLLRNKNTYAKQPFLIGTGGSTDLINAVELASQYDHLKGKKIALIISPQWFTDHGLTNKNFDARISKAQLNRLFNQNYLSPELKQRYAKRLLRFKNVENRKYLEKVAKGRTNNKDQYLSPFKMNQFEKIEAIKSNFPLSNTELENIKPVTAQDESWKMLLNKSEQYGAKHSKSNMFKIRDEYWQLIKKHKRKVNRDYEFNSNSPEFKDLELLVDTMREAGADIEYISLPSNGKWYDHIGVNKEKRQKVYNKIRETVVKHGGKIYDMTDKDYEPYVISDAVHIGWKGWVYISEHIAQHMRK
ncbi:D-alanyl-lipoteichoic acid biosynthesis protein DltD [Staphylococcus cohnii]|uniref:D-alanyl-lipoteichoic acid biosynthesis protein DltD n=1 Tax=Staphylococcus cohnii TaxID=29382 RepID=UPI003ACDBB20